MFSNNQATTYGAAIYSTQSLTLSGTASKFSSNYSTGNGGAVFHNSGILTIAESLGANDLQTTFGGNRTGWNFGTNAMTGNGQGGAVATSGIGLVIGGAGVQFIDNWAGSQGGAVLMNGAITFNADTVGSSGSLFQGNLAGSQGGAIYSLSGNNFKIENAGLITFKDNKAGIANFDTQTMKGTTGAVYADSGGAIFSFIGVAHKDSATLTVTDRTVIFDGNQAARYGGAVFSLGKMTMAGTASQFINNKAGLDGGAIYNATDALIFNGQLGASGERTTLQGNSAGWNFATGAMGPSGSGGAIYVSQGGDGGAGNYNPGSLTLGGNGLIFDKNQAAEHGGAVYSYGALNFNATAASGTTPRSVFKANMAGKNGGAIYNMTGDLTIANVGELIFSDNIAGWDYTTGAMRATTDTVGFGGALYSMDNVIITDRTAIFDGNAAAIDGGAVFSQAMMTMQGTASQFTGNIAGRHGGAIYNATGTLLFDGKVSGDGKKTTLSGNVAGWDFATGAMGTVGSGGAIYSMDKISFLGSGSIFEENIAAEYGGAIFSDNDLDFSATNAVHSEFNRNIAGKDGGAIYNESGNIDIINTGELIFRDNRAGWDYATNQMKSAIGTEGFGGALYSKTDVNITDRNILFENNMAAVSGGAIAAETGLDISGGANITFINNAAGAFGGAAYLSGDSVMDDATFIGNTAGKSGGAIYQWDDTTSTQSLTIRAVTNDVVFTDNYGGVTDTNTGYRNDINIAAGPVTFDTSNGYNILLGGGITSLDTDASGNEKLNEAGTSSLTMTGTGKVVFGSDSTTFVNGDITLDEGMTMQLDHGASFGRFFGIYGGTAVAPQKVGNFTADKDTTLAYRFDNDGISNTVLYGDTVTISDTTQFALQGIQYRTRMLYDLAESTYQDGNMTVTTGLDRSAFKTGILASDPNYFVRDLTYGRDNNGAVYSGNTAANLNNVYAVEFFSMSEVAGESPYYNPSWRNRILSDRAKLVVCQPTCCTACDTEDSDGCDAGCNHAVQYGIPQQKWQPWIQGYGSGSTINEYGTQPMADYNIGGLLAGFDYRTAHGMTFGVYYGYGKSATSNYFSNWDGHEHSFGVYRQRRYQVGYSLLSANFGFNSYSHKRTIGTFAETYSGNFSALTYGVYGEYGMDWHLSRTTKPTTLTPFVGLQYGDLHGGRYEENNVAPVADDLSLVVTNTLYNSFRSIVGTRHHTALTSCLAWNNSVRWEHEYLNRVGVLRQGYLKNYNDVTFNRESYAIGRDWFVFGTGLNFTIRNGLGINVGYDLSCNQNMTLHTGMAGLGYRF